MSSQRYCIFHENLNTVAIDFETVCPSHGSRLGKAYSILAYDCSIRSCRRSDRSSELALYNRRCRSECCTCLIHLLAVCFRRRPRWQNTRNIFSVWLRCDVQLLDTATLHLFSQSCALVAPEVAARADLSANRSRDVVRKKLNRGRSRLPSGLLREVLSSNHTLQYSAAM